MVKSSRKKRAMERVDIKSDGHGVEAWKSQIYLQDENVKIGHREFSSFPLSYVVYVLMC